MRVQEFVEDHSLIRVRPLNLEILRKYLYKFFKIIVIITLLPSPQMVSFSEFLSIFVFATVADDYEG